MSPQSEPPEAPAPGHPEIVRIVAPNPGPMTLSGTNTYLVGEAPAYVIDPGPADETHLAAIRAAAASRGGIGGVLLTHGHSDHSEGVEALGAPVLWGARAATDETHSMLAALAEPRAPLSALESEAEPVPSMERADVAGFTVVPTPGHAADHVAFVRGSVCFCGDLVLGEGSTIVPPAAGGGSLGAYMDSLRRVSELGCELLAPGHGPWITDPPARLREYIAHREERERRLREALAAGERSRERLLASVWDDVPEVLRPAAAIAMQAHLEKLAADGVDLAALTD